MARSLLKARFHASYADGEALYEVIQRLGTGVYLCVSQPEPDGRFSYTGIRRAFLRDEIEQGLARERQDQAEAERTHSFWLAVEVGSLLHLEDEPGCWVRLRVIEKTAEPVLVPVALVGGWEDTSDSIWTSRILAGEKVSLHPSNFYEWDPSYYHSDPLALPEVALPPREGRHARLEAFPVL